MRQQAALPDQQCLRDLRSARRVHEQLVPRRQVGRAELWRSGADHDGNDLHGIELSCEGASRRASAASSASFQANAPRRLTVMAQALDGTWERYQRETASTGQGGPTLPDAIDFVGWYHATSSRVNGIARNDAYNLYLAYYSGHAGYARGSWRGNAGVQKAANRAASMANTYAAQMQQCGRS
jgi:hypothetical protein